MCSGVQVFGFSGMDRLHQSEIPEGSNNSLGSRGAPAARHALGLCREWGRLLRPAHNGTSRFLGSVPVLLNSLGEVALQLLERGAGGVEVADDPAFLQNGDPAAHLGDVEEVMAGDEEGRSVFLVQASE